MSKLDTLARIEGKTVEELLASATFGSESKGICTNKGCNYTTETEPDQQEGYCEVCDTNTVVSACVLAGII